MKSGTVAIVGLIAFLVFACIMSTKGALGWLVVILVMVIVLLLEIMTKNTNGDADSSNIIHVDTSETSIEPVLNDDIYVCNHNAIAKANIQPTVSGAEAEAARKEAQLEWVLEELNRADAPTYQLQKDGSLKLMDKSAVPNNRVVVVPVFKYDRYGKRWVPTEEFIRQGSNKAFASLFLMALYNMNGREYWRGQQWILQSKKTTGYIIAAFAPMRLEDTERFDAGMILEGRIDIAYPQEPPNPNNVDQDKWYINADARELDIPCTDEHGNVYYQKRYFEDDLAYPVPPQPKIDHMKILEEIRRIKGNSA